MFYLILPGLLMFPSQLGRTKVIANVSHLLNLAEQHAISFSRTSVFESETNWIVILPLQLCHHLCLVNNVSFAQYLLSGLCTLLIDTSIIILHDALSHDVSVNTTFWAHSMSSLFHRWADLTKSEEFFRNQQTTPIIWLEILR